ncbi:hypothetical protein ACO2Q0_09095 [Phenylobacterium sp. VNQ135]|uniref:hypothetical protein n=1 Tax=Phenylobacterium sp. VNQ135 TaxID=3400922 RepID=UPI003C0B87D2
MRPRILSLVRLSAAGYALFLGLNAQAANSTPEPKGEPRGVAAAFGNTIKALYPDGKHQRIWLHADGSWDAVGRRGKASSGKWTVKGEKVCMKQSKPIPIPISYCTDFPTDGGVGAVWTSKDMTGEPIRITVVKGIERPEPAR